MLPLLQSVVSIFSRLKKWKSYDQRFNVRLTKRCSRLLRLGRRLLYIKNHRGRFNKKPKNLVMNRLKSLFLRNRLLGFRCENLGCKAYTDKLAFIQSSLGVGGRQFSYSFYNRLSSSIVSRREMQQAGLPKGYNSLFIISWFQFVR